jgi:hypothetical protein
MMTAVRSWYRDNHALVFFLAGQVVALVAAALSIMTYMVRLETRVQTLEVRGSPHLAEINTRLTVLEGTTADNKERLEKITEVMTRNLSINPDKK